MSKIVLSYIGGGRFLPGVPARDLSESDLIKSDLDIDDLVESGLYARPAKKKKSPSSENKMLGGGEENKE